MAWAPGGAARAQPQLQQAPPPDAAIVPDAEFEAALPKVGDDLKAPLAPLQSFDTPAPPPPDPALSEPLPPLATFDVTTPTEPAKAEAVENAATVRYRVVVEGLDQVGLEGRFRSLSALDKGDGQAANGAVVTARAREDERLAATILHSEGYYDAVVTSSVAPVPDQPNSVTATISAVPGPRYAFGAIAITGPATVPPGIAREALKLKSGDPIIAADVEAAEANVRLRLPQQGYPFVDLGERDVLLDPATHLGDYTLPVDPGARSSFGGFRTEGDLAFDAGHVAVLSRFRRGELYDSRKVDDLREAMVATGLFSSVAVEPIATGEPGPDGTELVDLRVIQQAGPPRTLAAQAGYATGQGFTLRGSWTHRNLFPPEGALIVAGVAGTQEQGASVTFRRSNAGKRDRTVNLALSASHQDYKAFEAYTASLIGSIARQSTPIWQKVWTWSYGFELVTTDEKRADPTRRRDDGTYFIAALPAQIGYDRSNNLLDPTKGFRLAARVSPEVSQRAKGAFDQYVRAQVDGSVYYPASDSLTIAARVRLGSIVGAARDRIAPSRRLYAGGGGSVRGFGYQELGPRDANNDPLGGRSLNEFAVEARYRFGNYGIVPFIDAGQVYQSSTPKFSDMRFGVGIGGRLYTNFGPIRVDIATPLDRRKGEARFTAYVSIGQAF
ncbi:BamA/TamA family outer membrane protein [Sphingomonas sp. MAH-20]|uniref:BamA/TamA family outer membrane protein n=1 Tax=Sphingomonas horti TaxID=2682842 RepID=A0A6I4IYT7_9SPHN|nr:MULTISPECIES: BamA/TamA family outer membrane protein [Sphingomonas]MBA2918348.1 BamA/TamA family outer membrane protein [Sphingomonas sp. CGMCC 1.13658]MVO77315.1 BamA/TamA family outer membrane protein [Sphingomonas horti]